MKTENYLFSKQHKPKWKYKPDYGIKGFKYAVFVILLASGIFGGLFYVLGIGVI